MTTRAPAASFDLSGIRFDGWVLALVSSDDGTERKAANHSAITLYRTTEGRFVVHSTLVRGGIAHEEARVFTSRRAAQDWLGFGSLSLQAYREAEWPL